MTRALLTLNSSSIRDQATSWIKKAPPGTRLEFRAPVRSLPQNDLMWARLTDIAKHINWHGQNLTPADWKDIFTASLRRARVVPNIDGDGFVQLGLHTSDLSKEEMGNLLDLIDAFGAERGVLFSDSSESTTAPQVEAQMKPEATQPGSVSGNPSETSAKEAPILGADAGGGGVTTVAPPPSLPEGWEITYAAALRRAQKTASLPKLAAQWWATHGGWEKHASGPHGEAAAAIYKTFETNFGNREAIERDLREIF